MKILSYAHEMVGALQRTSSRLQKIAILRRYPELKDLLRRTYDPLIRYHVTSKNAQERGRPTAEQEALSLEELLDRLWLRAVTGQAALDACASFASALGPDEREVFYGVLDKNLKGRIDVASINEAFPGLIDEPRCALAAKYGDLRAPLDFAQERWFYSRKCDGLRLHAVIDGDSITLLSRAGHEFETLGRLRDALQGLARRVREPAFVLDGEVSLVTPGGADDFQGIMKEIRRKGHTIERPHLHIFDCLTLEEFTSGSGTAPLSSRLARLDGIEEGPLVSVLEQRGVQGQAQLDEAFAESQKKGWEGLILRKDVGYEGKRTKNMLKMKAFEEAEYSVVGMEFGKIRFVQDGKEAEEEMLSAVTIVHEGNRVGVGSGFTLEQRQEFYKDPSLIMGKVITVSYFEATQNQRGGSSLRFPIVKAIHGDQRIT